MSTCPLAHRPGRWHLFTVLAGLYLAQSIPIYLILAAIPPILREAGVSRTAIGFLWVTMLPSVVRFLWAPAIDRLRPLTIGHRRGWILPTQLAIVGAIAALSFADPTAVWPIYIFSIAVAILVSTQDIATDGYATKMLAPADRPIGNAIQGGAVAVGVIVSSALSLVLYDRFGWQPAILTVAALSALPLIAVALMEEERTSPPLSLRPSLKHFLLRREALEVLTITLVYRASEGLVKAMEGPYLVDAGLPLSRIGYLSGVSTAIAGWAGSFVAALAVYRLGTATTLTGLGWLRTACFSLFAVHAVGLLEDQWSIMLASALQTLIRYMELVALSSLFMAVASKEQPGTDFTILSCASLTVYLAGSMSAGILADAIGYSALFLLAAIISGVATWWSARLLVSRS